MLLRASEFLQWPADSAIIFAGPSYHQVIMIALLNMQ